MHITPLWQKLKQIGILDKQFITLTSSLDQISQQIKNQQQLISERKNHIERIIAEHKKAVHDVNLKEAEIASLEEKITKKKERLAQAQNPKELSALTQELETLRKAQYQLEDACLTQMAECESYQRFIQHDLPLALKQCDEEEATIIALGQELETTKSAVNLNRNEQETIVRSITPEWLAKYQTMKTIIPDPIAPIMQNTCSACFYEVLAQDLVRLKLNAILPCKSCFRLLYCDTEQQP
ncbi:hypothetical protein FJ364_00605 [Candidatus Dependentiae bacterium]|nr:hypothetical protein [Candidatus Dependentiae bacterium]